MSRVVIAVMQEDGHWTRLEVPNGVQVIAYSEDESVHFAVEPLERLDTPTTARKDVG